MMKKMIAAGMAALFAFSTAICGSAITGFAEERNDLKFVYISKQLSHPWFIQEEMGIKKPVRNEYIPSGSINSSREIPTVSKKPPCVNSTGKVSTVSIMP